MQVHLSEHQVLEVKSKFADWINRLNDCEAIENKDFEVLLKNKHNPKGGRSSLDILSKWIFKTNK